ncbi:hypothetical protein BC937DRAFT_94431 [Endogone sp. FLAS-F59071]|nr:hypothetical protein BC937DRAFT_94431 [Endogone sp. FLAS-F59071]|eukprot:RUS20765.1 hypothetical protein BC937DRAFT_94431 [Endogone sp. FLAS-F59071]
MAEDCPFTNPKGRDVTLLFKTRATENLHPCLVLQPIMPPSLSQPTTIVLSATAATIVAALLAYYLVQNDRATKRRNYIRAQEKALSRSLYQIKSEHDRIVDTELRDLESVVSPPTKKSSKNGLESFNVPDHVKTDRRLLFVDDALLRLLERLDGIRPAAILPREGEANNMEAELVEKIKKRKRALIDGIQKHLRRVDQLKGVLAGMKVEEGSGQDGRDECHGMGSVDEFIGEGSQMINRVGSELNRETQDDEVEKHSANGVQVENGVAIEAEEATVQDDGAETRHVLEYATELIVDEIHGENDGKIGTIINGNAVKHEVIMKETMIEILNGSAEVFTKSEQNDMTAMQV